MATWRKANVIPGLGECICTAREASGPKLIWRRRSTRVRARSGIWRQIRIAAAAAGQSMAAFCLAAALERVEKNRKKNLEKLSKFA